MNSFTIIPYRLYRLIIPNNDIRIFLSIRQPYDELIPELVKRGISKEWLNDYVRSVSCCYGANGHTTLFPDIDTIVIKLNFTIRTVSDEAILVHELNHVAKRICDNYESEQGNELNNREEAEAYLQEYLFEDAMTLIQPCIEYVKRPRNMKWFHEITQELK